MDKTPIQLAANTTLFLREQTETINQHLPTLYDVTTGHEDATTDVSDCCYVWNSNADRLLWLEIRSGGRQTGIKLISTVAVVDKAPFYDDPERYTGGIHKTMRGIATKDYKRAYELIKYWRKLQGSGKLMASENTSTARDIDAEASSMQTDDNIRGIETDE